MCACVCVCANVIARAADDSSSKRSRRESDRRDDSLVDERKRSVTELVQVAGEIAVSPPPLRRPSFASPAPSPSPLSSAADISTCRTFFFPLV